MNGSNAVIPNGNGSGSALATINAVKSWIGHGLLLLLVGAISIAVSKMITTELAMQQFTDRLLVVEKTVGDIKSEQIVNSQFRLQNQLLLEHIQADIMENQRLLRLHSAQTAAAHRGMN